jgi:probable HAF family extracellular repeat protein
MNTLLMRGLALAGLALSMSSQAQTTYTGERVLDPVAGLQAGHGSQLDWAGRLLVSAAGQSLGTQAFPNLPLGGHQAFVQDGLGVRNIPTLPAYTNGELLGTGGQWAAGSAYNLGTDPSLSTRGRGQAMVVDLNTGSKRVLGTLGGISSQASDVNAAGVSVGHSWVAGNDHVTAFVADGSGMKPLFADQRISVATSINDRGDVAGQMAGLNSGGQTWGWGFVQGQVPHQGGGQPFLMSGGKLLMLDEVAGMDGSHANVVDLNNQGAVLLDRQGDTLGTSVVVQDGMVRVLDSLVLDAALVGPEGATRNPFTQGLDINDAGDVVGWSMEGIYEQRAVLWRGTQAIDLNDLWTAPEGVTLTAAWAIDNQGRIWAQGSDMAIYRLSAAAVPEPGTATSLLLGLVGLFWLLRFSRLKP